MVQPLSIVRAYENGRLNDYEGGGPVGIWAWDANRVVIQFNASHHNRTGSSKGRCWVRSGRRRDEFNRSI